MSTLFAAGIDVGGTSIAIGLVDSSGNLLIKKSLETKPQRSFEAIIQDIAGTVLLLLEQTGKKIEDISGTGFGVPSTIDPNTKKLIFANNLSWLNMDLAGEYTKYIPGQIYIENDAACAVLGEVKTDPQAGKNVLMITFGTGVGGGLIIDGKLFRGCDGFGIEPGHIVLVYGGRKCNCGNSGCVEAYCSVTALVEQTKEKMSEYPGSLMWDSCIDSGGSYNINLADSRTVFSAAKKGDSAALELLDNFTAMAGQAIANLITVFRPEKVIIGGGLCNEGDYFITALYEAAKKSYFGSGLMPMPPFNKARLGNDAGIVGAAMLAMQATAL